MAKIYWLSTEDPEWDKAWSSFRDRDMYNAAYGESLQYMGTIEVPGIGAGHYFHEFRHRAVPRTNQRQYWKVLATDGWYPREIAMQRHLERLGA